MNKILSQDEISALLQGFSDEAEEEKEATTPPEKTADILLFDFDQHKQRAQNCLTRWKNAHTLFVPLCANTLATHLRTSATLEQRTLNISKFGDIFSTLSIGKTCYAFKVKPLYGQAILTIDLRLAFALVEAMFGGDGFYLKEAQRALTNIEQRVMSHVVSSMLENLVQTWQTLGVPKLTLLSMEGDRHFVSMLSPADDVCIITFDVAWRTYISSFSVYVPYICMENMCSFGGFSTNNAKASFTTDNQIKE